MADDPKNNPIQQSGESERHRKPGQDPDNRQQDQKDNSKRNPSQQNPDEQDNQQEGGQRRAS